MFGSYALAIGRGEHRHSLRARAESIGLPVHVETRELLLVASEGTACLSGGDTVLVGHAFDGAGARLTSIRAGFGGLEQPGDPRGALRRTWGNYVLFAASPDQAFVYREPSGSVPVYRCGGQHSAIFVSDAAIAERLGIIAEPEIDPHFLVHWLQFPFLRTARSGLRKVTELLPGMSLSRRGLGGWTDAPVWHPSAFAAASRSIHDPAQASKRLRETALPVVAAQPIGRKIVLRLSGGLDSSIIAACLAVAKLEFSCINFATRARDGDERDYARAVARQAGVELIEVGEPDEVRLEVPTQRSFRPLINPLLEPFERAVIEAADDLGATLLIDGGGGDNLFCSITSAAPVIDALTIGSLGKAGRAAADIAARSNCTIWDVLVSAGRRLVKRRHLWKEDRSFLLPSALLKTCEPHPWLEGIAVAPGKREHVEALVHIHHFLDRSPSTIGFLHPLLAQPLLELCLRIPSWLWVRGGRDRAVAREAFAGLVPSSVLQRRMKGSLQSLLYRSFAQLRSELRVLLLEGELARSGIIDTAAIGEALTGQDWMTDAVQLRISEMAALELWLRSWRSRPAGSSTGS